MKFDDAFDHIGKSFGINLPKFYKNFYKNITLCFSIRAGKTIIDEMISMSAGGEVFVSVQTPRQYFTCCYSLDNMADIGIITDNLVQKVMGRQEPYELTKNYIEVFTSAKKLHNYDEDE